MQGARGVSNWLACMILFRDYPSVTLESMFASSCAEMPALRPADIVMELMIPRRVSNWTRYGVNRSI